MHYDVRAPGPARAEVAKAGATRGAALEHHEHRTVHGRPQGNEFSAEPAQRSSNNGQRTRPTRGFGRCPGRGSGVRWLRWGTLSRAWCPEADMNERPSCRRPDLQNDTGRVVDPISAGIRQPPAGQARGGAVAHHDSAAGRRCRTPADPQPVTGSGRHDDLEVSSCLDQEPGLRKQSR